VINPDSGDLESSLRRAERSSAAASTPCIGEIEMAAFVEGVLEGADRQRIAGHLVECADCRAQYAELCVVLGDASVAPAYDSHSPISVSVPARRHRVAGSFAFAGLAAAALLFAVARQQEPAGTETQLLRDEHGALVSVPVIVGPISVAYDTTAFLWSGVPGAELYRVTVFDAEGVVVWEAETADTVALHPSPSPFVPGEPYLWRVQARTDFDRWVGSRLAEFRIRGAELR